MAICRLTTDQEPDPFDGGETNAVRRRALELAERTFDDLSDVEVLSADGGSEFWYTDLCIQDLHRLPVEVTPLLTQSGYTHLQAYNLVKRAMEELQRRFYDRKPPPQH